MPKTPSLSQLMEPPDTPGGFNQNGWSTAHIAKHLNTHQRTVQRRLAETDITIHGTNQRRFKPPVGIHKTIYGGESVPTWAFGN